MTGESVDEAQAWLLSAIGTGRRWPGHTGFCARGDAHGFTLDLPDDPGSVREAREFALTGLRSWGLAAMYDDVGLVVSELVTNALRHAVTGLSSTADAPIRFGLLHGDGRLTCAVTDPSDRPPVRREADFSAQNGRGLHLVDAFSDSWDWAPLYGRGKVVWACFLVCAGFF